MTRVSKYASKIVGIEGWHGFKFESVTNGLIVTGAVAPPKTKGPAKGRPNWRKMDRFTLRTVILSDDDLMKIDKELKRELSS